MPNFQTFRRAYATGAAEPIVAVHARGIFGLNEAAYDALGRPDGVVLLYDPEEKVIGLQPAGKDNPDAYQVRKHTRHNYQVAANAFLNFYKIPESVRGRRYMAETVDGILAVDLRQP